MKLTGKITWYIRLLQMENYDTGRFWQKIRKKQRSLASKDSIIWTAKLQAVIVVALLLDLFLGLMTGIIVGIIFDLSGGWRLLLSFISAALLLFSFFIPLLLGTWLMKPFDWLVKYQIIWRARQKLRKNTKLKIVAITGSYGKTTHKEIIASLLQEKYQVLKTPENINTPIGIARFILEKITDQTEIFVVEMGAYKKGDIQKLCRLAPPDISVVTGINESHLERFGSIRNTIQTKFEIVDNAKKNTTILLNADNAHIVQEYKQHADSRPVIFYGFNKNGLSHYQVENYHFSPETLKSRFDINNTITVTVFHFTIPLIGKYAASTVAAGVAVAEIFNMKKTDIQRGALNIQPISHRLQAFRPSQHLTVIDDSYNGNPEGVAQAISVLSQFHGQRKIFVTPGLVEMGDETEKIHRRIGQQLSSVADIVVLMKNSVTPWIADELKNNHFDQKNISWYHRSEDRQKLLTGLIKEHDVILFQNDWPDNYF